CIMTAAAFTTTLSLDDCTAIEVIWRINPAAASFQTVDVTLRPSALNPPGALANGTVTGMAHAFLLDCNRLTANATRSIKLVLATVDGFVGRGRFFEQRLVDCPFLERVEGFLSLDQSTGPLELSSPTSDSFHAILSSAAAGLLVQSSTGNDSLALASIETELEARLSLRWIFPSPVPRRNVVLIEGYQLYQTGGGGGGGSLTGPGMIQAVRDFNVSVIALGTGEPCGPKHWLQHPENAPGFCDAFIPIDMTIDDELPLRIVSAIREYKGFDRVDGIFTGHDRYLVPTAKAADLLGLPASPVRAYEIATDKYAMRQFEVESQGGDFQFLRFFDLEDMKRQLTATENRVVIRYPAIVKPVGGYLSEGVARVSGDAELIASVARIDNKRHGHAVIVETYIDGPEFDANIVLCEGEILFFELVDDFPSGGDIPGAGAEGTFFETSEFTPSNLPYTERELVMRSVHKTLLALGFTWGLFHVEGRVKDSTMEFRTDASGIVDLRPRLARRAAPPACFLVEINARIPGLGCAMSTMHSYGVDYYAAYLLAFLRDVPRLRLVTSTFAFPGRADGSQYWCEVVFIQPDRGGRFDSEDPCEELLSRLPQLEANVSRHLCCYKKHDVIPDPKTGVCLLLAYFLAYSRESREHVREVSEMIRKEFRYRIAD
ncbi:ATP-grasp domain-containing protein, partial [Mycena pura]